MLLKVRIRFLLVLLLLFGLSGNALANGEPAEVVRMYGSTMIYPKEDTPLEVVKEELFFDIDSYTAQVTAKYVVSNPTKEPITTDIVFYVPDYAAEEQVFLNGEPLAMLGYCGRGDSTVTICRYVLT